MGKREGEMSGCIFAPTQAPDGAWECKVVFDGLYSHSALIVGHDSFQALSLAIRFYNDYLLDRIAANPDGVFDDVGLAAVNLFSEWGLR